MDLGDVGRPAFWNRLRSFRPDVVHYVVGNTLRGVVLAAMLRRASRSPVVVSVNHPGTSRVMRGEAGPTAERALARARPDLALVQARSTAAVLERAGWKCRLLPNAVDTARFRPADDSVRAALRERFGFRPDERVVLHLGHLKPKRNLEALVPLVAAGTRVVVVASTYQGVDPAVHRRLVRAGLDVRTGYVPDVERLYSAADVYAFPVRRGATLQMPLSVLEALACDRPVVSVPHEGLVEFLEEGDGLTFAEPEAFAKAVRGASAAGVRTRAKVLACGVDVVVPRLERHYESVLEAAA